MNYIDQVCERIVNPPKLRYSSYDLGILTTNQDLTLLIMQKDMTSPSLISTASKFKQASIYHIAINHKYAFSTYILWMALVYKVPSLFNKVSAMSKISWKWALLFVALILAGAEIRKEVVFLLEQIKRMTFIS